jgi:hypothetical protein
MIEIIPGIEMMNNRHDDHAVIIRNKSAVFGRLFRRGGINGGKIFCVLERPL